eukprot:GHRR01012476.1.p1 GENE.GHRR01012476.1~~GHRR01012476.1.p1  ORF type:complete len:303 (+),score=70.95 GHRR01012476.1:565-1473(+)
MLCITYRQCAVNSSCCSPGQPGSLLLLQSWQSHTSPRAAGLQSKASARGTLCSTATWEVLLCRTGCSLQVSQALGSCSNLGGVTLHQGLLDYTSELYRASFIPLRRMTLNKPPAHKRLLRLTGTLLLAWGAIAGAGMIAGKARGAGRDGKWSHLPLPQPVEKVLQEVEEAGKAAGKALGDVAVTAMTAPVHGIGEIGNKLKQVVNVGIKAEHELQHGVGKATHTAVEIAEETAGVGPAATKVPKGKVHGDLPGQTTLPGPVKRFRKAVVGRAVAAGTMVGKPFGKLLKHRVTHQVAEHLGAF